MNHYFRLLSFLRPYLWPYFTLAMLCMVIFGATDGALPFLVQRIIDDVFTHKDPSALRYLPAVIVAFFAFR